MPSGKPVVVKQVEGESESDFFDKLASTIEEIHALKHIEGLEDEKEKSN